MDRHAWRVRELVLDSCRLLEGGASAGPADAVLCELAHIRADLLDAAHATCDAEAYDAACGMVDEIDVVLAATAASAHRGAA